MKIGVLTLHNAHNCGAVLQCYALTEYLRAKGHEVSVIDYRIPSVERTYRLRPEVMVSDKLAALLSRARMGEKLLSPYIQRHLREITAVRKRDAFRAFASRLHLTPRCKDANAFRRVCESFDALITGSDQVWNPSVMGRGFHPAFFLPFARRDATRIAYAVSTGVPELTPERQALFRFWLRNLDAISMREASGRTQIAPLTDKPVTEVLDPVFLLSKEQMSALEIPYKASRPYVYVHNVHLTKTDSRLDSVAQAVAKRLGLAIVTNRADSNYENLMGVCSGGPMEFLGCIRGAAFVVTNSFHATAFSILYHKCFATVPNATSPERQLQLLRKFGLEDHAVTCPQDLPEQADCRAADSAQLDALLQTERRKSIQFLECALETPHQADTRSYLLTGDSYRCYGCGACAAACAANAITLCPDQAGFLYPKVDARRCVHCGRCEKICFYGKLPATFPEPAIYAVRHRNPDEVKTSNSGAAFPALAAQIMAWGGRVIGVEMAESLQPTYAEADTEAKWRRFKGSKYVAADNRGILATAKQTLQQGYPLLFSGTPCQIAGLYACLGRDYENLYTVNILCMGVGSPEVFRQYRQHISAVYESELTRFSFRSDFRGQKQHYVDLGFASGASLLEQSRENGYQSLYAKCLILRPSCYACPFRPKGDGTASLPAGDITLGDFWRIEKTHPRFARGGDSSLLQVNTEKGKRLLDAVRSQLFFIESAAKNGYRIYSKVFPPFSPEAADMQVKLSKGEALYE